MPPSITSVNVTPSVLTPGESQVYVEAIVSDVVGVTNVYAQAYDPFMGIWTSEVILLTLASGDSLNGTYGENIVFPPDVNDGQYGIVVFASNAESVEGDWDTYGQNYDGIVSLERGVTVSDINPPVITSMNVNPPVLTAGEGQATVTVTITDDVGVISVAAVVIDRYTLLPVSIWNELGLDLGTPQDGTWNGTIIIPYGIEDGDHYRVAIRASDEAGNYIESQDLAISLQRGTGPPPPETNGEGKCCCDVSININSGPVNIYVCRSDMKPDIPP
jgi:hypothetical protein